MLCQKFLSNSICRESIMKKLTITIIAATLFSAGAAHAQPMPESMPVPLAPPSAIAVIAHDADARVPRIKAQAVELKKRAATAPAEQLARLQLEASATLIEQLAQLQRTGIIAASDFAAKLVYLVKNPYAKN